jgi:hypothetical protein
MMSRRRKLVSGGVVIAAALGAGGFAIAANNGSEAAAPPQRTMRSEPPQHYTSAALSPQTTQEFGVLRATATAEDKLPQKALDASASYGSIPDGARMARDTPRGPLYVIPGANDRICLMDENGTGGCTFGDLAAQGQLITTLDHFPGLKDGEVEIQGLVPDGVQSVTVTLRHGTDRTLPIVNNVFDAVLPDGPAKVIWDDGRGIDAPWIP